MGVNVARFASTLAILTGSGVPLLRALDAARRTLGNDRLRNAVDDATARVREGATLASALGAQRVFPSLLIHLTASGEKTGTLPTMLERGAQTLARELERRAMAMTALLEPAMILVMGGFVLMIVLAIMMPIMEINQFVR
jgi:general secretion pathway protein F